MLGGFQIEVTNAELPHHVVHRSHGFICLSFVEFEKEITQFSNLVLKMY